MPHIPRAHIGTVLQSCRRNCVGNRPVDGVLTNFEVAHTAAVLVVEQGTMTPDAVNELHRAANNLVCDTTDPCARITAFTEGIAEALDEIGRKQ